MAGARRCGSPRHRVKQPRAEPSAPKSVVFSVDAVRCFIFDELRKIKMGHEATIALGFDQVSLIISCSRRDVDFYRPHDLPGQTHKKKNDNETGKSTAAASFDAIIKKNNEQDQSEKKKKSSSFSGSSSSGNGSSNGGGDSSNSSKQRGLEVESGASPKGKTSALSEGEGEKKKRKKKKKRGEGPPAPKDRRLELYT